jgi:hypothetical protein
MKIVVLKDSIKTKYTRTPDVVIYSWEVRVVQ